MPTKLLSRIQKPIIKVKHSDLEPVTYDYAFKRECPLCGGVLPLQRDGLGYLLPTDRCMLCGQQFFYTDIAEERKGRRLHREGTW